MLERTAAECKGGSVIPVVGDVTSKDSLAAVAERVASEQGYINVLFANSGSSGAGATNDMPKDRPPTLKEYKDAMWAKSMEANTQTMHVNFTGVLYTALAFLELLDAGNKAAVVSQKSQIIVTASVAAFNRSMATSPAYSASKAAAVSLTKTLATHLGQYHIRVNSLAPGFYLSAMTVNQRNLKEGKDPTEEGSLPNTIVPLERMGTEDDMAATLLYMMGRGGSYLSGSVMVTDGGLLGQRSSSY